MKLKAFSSTPSLIDTHKPRTKPELMRKLYTCLLLSFQLLTVNAQWTQITSPFPGNLWSMAFFTDNLGYMNTNGYLLKTTDGGTTWTSTSILGNVDGDFSFPTSTVGYIAGDYDVIRKTTDQGATWTTLTINNQALPIYSASFVDANTGYVVGVNGFIRKTTNGGATWAAQSTSGSPNLKHVHFVNADLGTAIGDNGAIRHTMNGGTTWSAVFGAPATYLKDIFFLNSSIGFIVGGQGTMLKTVDGGATWSVMSSGTTEPLSAVCFRTEQEGYVGGMSGFMMKTTDGGVTWTTEDNPFFYSTQHINDIIFKNGHYIAIGDGGHITMSGAVGIPSVEQDVAPVEIGPNPASNSVMIHVPGRMPLPCKVRIYDGTGALVRTNSLSAGEKRMDVEDLNDGLYVVEVEMASSVVRQKLVVQH
jgi:photosystem II stability/assembly factor-like uncharacterized protein